MSASEHSRLSAVPMQRSQTSAASNRAAANAEATTEAFRQITTEQPTARALTALRTLPGQRTGLSSEDTNPALRHFPPPTSGRYRPVTTPRWTEQTPAPRPQLSVAPVPAAEGVQLKRRDPVAAWLGLPLVTLGLYHYVWLYSIHTELGRHDRRRHVGPAGPLLAWIFGVMTLGIWPLVTTHRTGEAIAAAQRSAGLPVTCRGGRGVLLVFLLGSHVLYYQGELNKIVDSNPAAPAGAPIPLWV